MVKSYDFQVSDAIARLESENDMVLVPRGLLGAAAGAIRRPEHKADMTLEALRHYAFQKKEAAQPILGDDSAVELLASDLMKRIDKITGERLSIATLGSLRVSVVGSCRAAMIKSK